jgi:membrane-bound lytic murein transglycosylase D
MIKGFLNFFLIASVLVTSNGVNAQDSRSAVRQDDAVLEKVADTLNKSGNAFRSGLAFLASDDKVSARREFDRATKFFIESGLRANVTVRFADCRGLLEETVFRLEYPDRGRVAEISKLFSVCGWGDPGELANIGGKIVGPDLVNQANGVVQSDESKSGFVSQGHDPSPLDELARLVLNEEEEDVDSPTARNQLRILESAAVNRSLGFSFQAHPKVQQYINYYQGRGRQTMNIGLYRSGMFMRMARRIFREEGVPENVAWLGQVESAWKPLAMSWASAAGLWQFIPATGSRFGLRRTAYLDERNSFEAATRASARYLKFLANRYDGNWELAMAAYNTGEGNVDRAISRAGGVKNFWVIYPYLAQETRNYVPNILATIIIANNPAQYGFGHVKPAPPLAWDQIRVPALTNLSLIAQASDTTVEYLRYLNPELRTNTTPPENYIVRVPPGRGDNVVAVFRNLPAGRSGAVALVSSVRGESWQNVSERTGVSVEELRAANPGMSNPNGKMIVPAKEPVVLTASLRPTTVEEEKKPVEGTTITVKKGDNLSRIAKRHGVSVGQLVEANNLSSATAPLKIGRTLIIPSK